MDTPSVAIKVVILLSAGVHPLSGRPRRADLDARALELALRLGSEHSAITLHAVHAGSGDEASLGRYLGMGLDRLTVLSTPPGADALPPLVAHISRLDPAITLAGMQGEGEDGSGFLPYALAHALGLTFAPAIVDLALDGSRVRLSQALPRGQRRFLSASLPVLVTINRSASEPRQSAYGKARRGRVDVLDVAATPDRWRQEWRAVPARKRPRHIAPPVSGSAAERLRATMEIKAGSGTILRNLTAEVAARAIWDFLLVNGLATAPSGQAETEKQGSSVPEHG